MILILSTSEVSVLEIQYVIRYILNTAEGEMLRMYS